MEQALTSAGTVYGESRATATGVHNDFLLACRQAGLTDHDYPFCTADQGRHAIRKYIARWRADHPQTTATAFTGAGGAQRLKIATGRLALLPDAEFLDAVQQDGHTIDMIGIIRIPHPRGPVGIPLSRFELQLIVDVGTRAALGYSVCLKRNASAQHALEAVRHALTPWKPIEMERRVIPYPNCAGFPSSLPQLEGVGWAMHYLDNASIYTSVPMMERLRRRIGCTLNYGPVRGWTRRHVVEGVFSVLERSGFQRMPSTVGSHPKDPRRVEAEAKAIATQMEYDVLLYLIDVAIATYNGTAQPSLGNRSPMDLVRERVEHPLSNFLPRPLPPLLPGQADMHIMEERRRVRGATRDARHPYVEIDEANYTNPLLTSAHHLIGQVILVQVDPDDLRTVRAMTLEGEDLGVLQVECKWRQCKHSRSMRKEINARKRDGRLRMEGHETDWVKAHLRLLAQEAVLKAGPKTGSNVAASELAEAVRRADAPVPSLPEAMPGPSASGLPRLPADAEEPLPLPAFLVRRGRRLVI